jgi:nucleotide-binding universal stress UspA family protein
MGPTNHVSLEPALKAETVSQGASASTIKTILLHIQNDRTLEARLQAALSLARAAEAHLRCLHVTPIEAYVTMDGFGGLFVMDKLMAQVDQEEEKLRSALERRLTAEDVTWDYQQVTANTVSEVVRCAALSDIVITGRQAHVGREQSLEISILGDLLMAIRTPLLIPGDNQAVFDPFGRAVIAWNGSYEAANAVRNAIALLKLSSDVHVIRFCSGDEAPPTVLLEYLSRQGIHAQLETWVQDDETVPELLVEYAQAKAASYVVMGGYGHNRAGEFLFGGVTRTLLKACPIALALAH